MYSIFIIKFKQKKKQNINDFFFIKNRMDLKHGYRIFCFYFFLFKLNFI